MSENLARGTWENISGKGISMGHGPEVRKSSMWSKNQRQGTWLEGTVVQGETEEEAQAERRGVPCPGSLSGFFSSRRETEQSLGVGYVVRGPVRRALTRFLTALATTSHLHLPDLLLQLHAHHLQLLLPLQGRLAFREMGRASAAPAQGLPGPLWP